jgi:hypothetical protein
MNRVGLTLLVLTVMAATPAVAAPLHRLESDFERCVDPTVATCPGGGAFAGTALIIQNAPAGVPTLDGEQINLFAFTARLGHGSRDENPIVAAVLPVAGSALQVPEPALMALFGVGLLGAAARFRRW